MFHYLLPEIGGDARNDAPLRNNVPSYFRQGSAWIDKEAGRGIGCWFTQADAFLCNYWKGPAGDFHPDLRQTTDHELKPGERVDIEGARAFFFPLEDITREGFGRAVERVAEDAVARVFHK